MKIFIAMRNTGPSWQSDPIHLLGVGFTAEQAEMGLNESDTDFIGRYEINFEGREPSLPEASYHPERVEHVYAYCPIKDAKPYRVAQADGWWVAIFVIDRDGTESSEFLHLDSVFSTRQRECYKRRSAIGDQIGELYVSIRAQMRTRFEVQK